ncbi:MAG: hypothetical protein AB1349_02065 [Elusimicrobiota bacterium]
MKNKQENVAKKISVKTANTKTFFVHETVYIDENVEIGEGTTKTHLLKKVLLSVRMPR